MKKLRLRLEDSWIVYAMTSVLMLSLLTVVVAFSTFGSLPAALTFLQGRRLLVDDARKTFETVEEGQSRTIPFTLMNYSSKPVMLLGAQGDCTCILIEGLPLTIPVGGQSEFQVVYRATNGSGRFDQSIRVFTNLPTEQEIHLTVRGTVIKPNQTLANASIERAD